MCIEIRVDAWKLCQVCRRPEPRSAEDIGTWQTILETITLCAVLTNSALVAFTGTFALDETWASRGWVFFSMAFGIILINYIIGLTVPDIPTETEIQLRRQDYICGKVLDNVVVS